MLGLELWGGFHFWAMQEAFSSTVSRTLWPKPPTQSRAFFGLPSNPTGTTGQCEM